MTISSGGISNGLRNGGSPTKKWRVAIIAKVEPSDETVVLKRERIAKRLSNVYDLAKSACLALVFYEYSRK